jgi:hypothetical protein
MACGFSFALTSHAERLIFAGFAVQCDRFRAVKRAWIEPP